MYTKLFSSILDSSVWLEDLPTKVLWITMLAMADEDGIVAASVGGLAKRAGIGREECEHGLARFLAPDPDSRSEEHEGRRIEKVPGGWLLLNHGAYREIRTARQLKEAERQRRHREKLARGRALHGHAGVEDVTVTGVTERDSHDASQSSRSTPPIASASASVTERSSEEDQEPVGREGTDPLDAVLAEAGLDLAEFEPHGAAELRSFLRSLRSPFPAATILRSHLKDEECPPKALVIAVREYAALGRDRLEARHFAGFVRKAKADLAQAPVRAMGRSEERFITNEDIEAERARREEAEVNELLTDFERRHGNEFEVLVAAAEVSVDAKIKGQFRAPMVRSALVKLVRLWLADDAKQGGQRAAS